MMRCCRSPGLLLVAWTAACHSPPAQSVRPAIDLASSAPAVAAAPTASAPAADRPGYLLLRDGSLHVDDGTPVRGLFVRGTLRDGRLTPVGDVEGEGPLGEAGQPGWMELADGTFHGDQTARPPFKPFLRGFRTPEGEFRPSSRGVVY